MLQIPTHIRKVDSGTLFDVRYIRLLQVFLRLTDPGWERVTLSKSLLVETKPSHLRIPKICGTKQISLESLGERYHYHWLLLILHSYRNIDDVIMYCWAETAQYLTSAAHYRYSSDIKRVLCPVIGCSDTLDPPPWDKFGKYWRKRAISYESIC